MFLAPVSLDLNGGNWSFWVNSQGDLMVQEPSGRESPEPRRPEIKFLARGVAGFDVVSLPAVGDGPQAETGILVVYAHTSGKLGQVWYQGPEGWGSAQPTGLILSEMEAGARSPSLARRGERIWLTYAAAPPDGGWCLWQRSLEEGEWSPAVAIDFGSEGTVEAGLMMLDGRGIAHLFYLWEGSEAGSKLFYRYRYPLMLDWAEVSTFAAAEGATGLPACCLDPAGNLLLAWLVEEGQGAQIWFARHLSGGWPAGGWEEARLVASVPSWSKSGSQASSQAGRGGYAETGNQATPAGGGYCLTGSGPWLALQADPEIIEVRLLAGEKGQSFSSLDGGKTWSGPKEQVGSGEANPVRVYVFGRQGEARRLGLEEAGSQGMAMVEAPVVVGGEAAPAAQPGEDREGPSPEKAEAAVAPELSKPELSARARLQLIQPLRAQGAGIQLVPSGGRFPAMRWPQARATTEPVGGGTGLAAGSERAGQELAGMEDYLRRLRQYIRELEERNVRLEGTIMEKNRRLSLVADASRQYITRAQALSDELKEKQRLAQSLQNELQAFQKEVQASQAELTRIQREREALEQQNRRLTGEVEHLRQVIEQLRREMEAKTQEVGQLKEKLVELELRNQELKNALAEKRARFWERLKRQF